VLILFPRLSNGNVLWSCDNCDNTAEVSEFDTNAVALVCNCDMKTHPECNSKWYYERLYYNKQAQEKGFEPYKKNN
jgi:hypothetical protein